jgi:hypothetical protein
MAQMQDEVIGLLSDYIGNDVCFTYTGKKGIQLFFDVTGDATHAAMKAKMLIKAQTWGSVLFFNATAA